jgi:thiosulfate/3-mercaptopyruvate sulfurtransferase
VTPPKQSSWHGDLDWSKVAKWSEVAAGLGQPGVAVLDTRSDDEYFGRVARAARGGAIPGAVHIEWTDNLRDGRFKPAAELRQMYEKAGVTPDREVMTYCQGGYRAAHGYLALQLAGYPNVRNYTGSWKEWGDRTDLPIEVPTK